MTTISEWSLPFLISTHKRFVIPFLPCLVNEGSERAALVGTWPPARVNPPHLLWLFLSNCAFQIKQSGMKSQKSQIWLICITDREWVKPYANVGLSTGIILCQLKGNFSLAVHHSCGSKGTRIRMRGTEQLNHYHFSVFSLPGGGLHYFVVGLSSMSTK